MSLSRLGRAAQWYAGKFGWKVFPLAPRSKIPALKGGRGCLDASDDPETIWRWWSDIPEANVGLATGNASGFWVLDVDPRSAGDISLEQMVELYGALPETVLGLTGGGGQHILMGLDISMERIKWKPVGQGLDCKGTGGYVVAPPSIHPETGREYAWEASARPGDIPIAPTPTWLLQLLWRHRVGRARPGYAAVSSCDPTSFLLGRLFSEHGWLGKEIKPGVWSVICPTSQLHTIGSDFDTSTILFAPSEGRSVGWFHCSHGHCEMLFKSYGDVVNALSRSERIPQ